VKGPQLKRLVEQHLLPHLPGFLYGRRLLYQRPVAPLLRGILFDSSGFTAEGFYLDVFVMPLCTEPQDSIVLSHGRRLEPQWIDLVPGEEAKGMARAREAIIREALPYLDQRDSLAAFVATDRARIARGNNPPELLDLACSYLFLGEAGEAQRTLQRIIRLVEDCPDPRKHDLERRSRAQELVVALNRGLSVAQVVLDAWCKTTLAALRLD
jgi:hypothetical protein